ncbi:MAG TPA: hypothetical protein VFL29_02580 [Candidatus Dormibacteraeota bacterium]|nr:hypothetical protein [Candidatus Dormibacteraeota bacterium]
MPDRGATRALVLGLLSLPFGILSPFAIWSASRSLRRSPSTSAWIGLAGGLLGAVFAVGGIVFWLLLS